MFSLTDFFEKYTTINFNVLWQALYNECSPSGKLGKIYLEIANSSVKGGVDYLPYVFENTSPIFCTKHDCFLTYDELIKRQIYSIILDEVYPEGPLDTDSLSAAFGVLRELGEIMTLHEAGVITIAPSLYGDVRSLSDLIEYPCDFNFCLALFYSRLCDENEFANNIEALLTENAIYQSIKQSLITIT